MVKEGELQWPLTYRSYGEWAYKSQDIFLLSLISDNVLLVLALSLVYLINPSDKQQKLIILINHIKLIKNPSQKEEV